VGSVGKKKSARWRKNLGVKTKAREGCRSLDKNEPWSSENFQARTKKTDSPDWTAGGRNGGAEKKAGLRGRGGGGEMKEPGRKLKGQGEGGRAKVKTQKNL